ncbi:MAG: hypothetical protein K8S55_02100 [Phycisphaerae bacterium]|nr:hypothetical protein [Phycisphaerae bacterium]
MTHREQIIAVINGEKPDVIPLYLESPMDVTVFRDLMPQPTGDWIADGLAQTNFFDNCTCNVGIGISSETISKDDDHHCYRYETGAVWHESYRPTFCREATEFPINSPEDAMKFEMPDANKPGRLDEKYCKKGINAFHDAGYFVQGGIMGTWAAIYYYLTSFENILMWMAIEPEAAHRLFEMTRRFSIDSARRLLALGVDCIFTCSDLGSGSALLFSPAMFRKYVFPWLKELADLCHEHGAYLHLHSHGHIEDLMDGIVEAGVDILNPVGPSDHNDLAMFKSRWGDKITLNGGMSTKINTMSKKEIQEHVTEVISIGRVGGRFFPRTESGIPPMDLERCKYYLEVMKQQRLGGYA